MLATIGDSGQQFRDAPARADDEVAQLLQCNSELGNSDADGTLARFRIVALGRGGLSTKKHDSGAEGGRDRFTTGPHAFKLEERLSIR